MKKRVLKLVSAVVLMSMLAMFTCFAADLPTISGQNTPPDTLNVGQAFSIKGTISSSTNITKVTVGVYNSSGVAETEKSATPNTKSYNISNLDRYITFDKLTAGTKTYKVFAQNSSGYATLVNKKFTVKSTATGTYCFPVPGYSYGSCQLNCTCSIHNGTHNGVDISAPNGTKIVAANSGTVTIVSTCTENYSKNGKCPCGKCGNQGNCIKITNGNTSTIYMHMASIAVSNGATVTAGQKIGTVGTTGWSTGGHLHFGLMIDGVYKNPPAYIKK